MTTHTPPRTNNSAMSADTGAAASKKIVLLNSGNYPANSNYLNQTWIFTGTDWTNLSVTSPIDSSGPLPGRTGASMAYDGTNVVLFGGKGQASADGVLSDTWVWSSGGQSWSKAAPATSPSGRFNCEAAYLSGTGTVLFGGTNLLYNLLETWVWNGTTWTQIAIPNGTGPAARINHCMAGSGAISAVQSVILFGGEGTNSQFNDTWQYTTASGWAKLSPATSPSVRSGACMAYDSTSSLWVMFGGHDEYNYLDETWTFNGTTWTQRSIGAGPSGRIGACMAFDSQSATTIMFGGTSATDSYASGETWAFNGSTFVWAKL